MRNNEEELLRQAEKTARELVEKLTSVGETVALAESCTGGMVSALLTGVSGASKVLWGSFICYTREAKASMLDIDDGVLSRGLVSEETAKAMANGALQKSGASLAAAVTGLAGPKGDGSPVPVGKVIIALARKNGEFAVKKFDFTGTREEIRLRASVEILKIIIDCPV